MPGRLLTLLSLAVALGGATPLLNPAAQPGSAVADVLLSSALSTTTAAAATGEATLVERAAAAAPATSAKPTAAAAAPARLPDRRTRKPKCVSTMVCMDFMGCEKRYGGCFDKRFCNGNSSPFPIPTCTAQPNLYQEFLDQVEAS